MRYPYNHSISFIDNVNAIYAAYTKDLVSKGQYIKRPLTYILGPEEFAQARAMSYALSEIRTKEGGTILPSRAWVEDAKRLSAFDINLYEKLGESWFEILNAEDAPAALATYGLPVLT